MVFGTLQSCLDKRVKACRHKRNLGVVAAFNSAFLLAAGDYRTISCADDINDAGRISDSLELLTSSKSDILSACMLKFNNHGEPLGIGGVPGGFLGGTLFFSRRIANEIYPIPEHLHCTDRWIMALTSLHGWKHIHSNSISAYYRLHARNDVITPYMNFSEYQSRLTKFFQRDNDFLNTYLHYVKGKRLPLSEKSLASLNRRMLINGLIINRQQHPWPQRAWCYFKAFSNSRDWYRGLLWMLRLSYLTYLKTMGHYLVERLKMRATGLQKATILKTMITGQSGARCAPADFSVRQKR